ncbi:MAG: NAD-dependent epimerase/dehydratase family protein [Pedobacter sp.]|nr:MAG: NAD-dependent epimerase/dehydratase family protein [Pedobacter sp.]
MNKTALVIGATGLVGSELVKLLIADSRFGRVIVFARKSTTVTAEKLEEHIIDFDKPESWSDLVKGDVLFSCLGTTLSQAGSKDAQYKIDYTYQYQFAQAAATNGVKTYILVSSAGADPKSMIFYSRIKGELERDVKKLPFNSVYLIQPSLLVGERENSRFGEKLSFRILTALNSFGLFKKYKPITGNTVAKALLNASIKAEKGHREITLDKVFDLS